MQMSLVIGSFVDEHLPPWTQRAGQARLRGEQTANPRWAEAAWESEGSICSSVSLAWASAYTSLTTGSSLPKKSSPSPRAEPAFLPVSLPKSLILPPGPQGKAVRKEVAVLLRDESGCQGAPLHGNEALPPMGSYDKNG